MTTYIALLRGINVGGKGAVAMAELRECMTKAGFTNVRTYINSGNVIFDARDGANDNLVDTIERLLAKQFGFELKIVLMTAETYKQIMAEVPTFWGKDPAWRHNLIFVRPPCRPGDVLADIGDLRVQYEQAVAGDQVVYHSGFIAHITKTHLPRITAKPSYKHLTIRNSNTCQKLLTLLAA